MKEWEKAVQRAMKERQTYGMVDHGKGRIEVHYYGELDTKLDAKIKRAMAKVGYEFTGSGYLFPKNKRDVCFQRV